MNTKIITLTSNQLNIRLGSSSPSHLIHCIFCSGSYRNEGTNSLLGTEPKVRVLTL